MAQLEILLLDRQSVAEAILKQISHGTGLKIVRVATISDARKRIVTQTPDIILFGADDIEESLGFIGGLQAHPVLRSVPVILLSSEVGIETRAGEVGVQTILPRIPLENQLRAALSPRFPELKLAEKPAQLTPPPAAPAVTPQQTTSKVPEKEDHFMIAQKLLAQVLHNLKTSQVLGAAEKEDIPRIVVEMTKQVCTNSSNKSQQTGDDFDFSRAMKKN